MPYKYSLVSENGVRGLKSIYGGMIMSDFEFTILRTPLCFGLYLSHIIIIIIFTQLRYPSTGPSKHLQCLNDS